MAGDTLAPYVAMLFSSNHDIIFIMQDEIVIGFNEGFLHLSTKPHITPTPVPSPLIFSGTENKLCKYVFFYVSQQSLEILFTCVLKTVRRNQLLSESSCDKKEHKGNHSKVFMFQTNPHQIIEYGYWQVRLILSKANWYEHHP